MIETNRAHPAPRQSSRRSRMRSSGHKAAVPARRTPARWS